MDSYALARMFEFKMIPGHSISHFNVDMLARVNPVFLRPGLKDNEQSALSSISIGKFLSNGNFLSLYFMSEIILSIYSARPRAIQRLNW
jgi:hypothetical protein